MRGGDCVACVLYRSRLQLCTAVLPALLLRRAIVGDRFVGSRVADDGSPTASEFFKKTLECIRLGEIRDGRAVLWEGMRSEEAVSGTHVDCEFASVAETRRLCRQCG